MINELIIESNETATVCSSLVCSEPTVCGNWSGVTFGSWCEKVQIETESIRGSLIRGDTTSANHLLANTN